jgi:AraC-like DNA-binding protein
VQCGWEEFWVGFKGTYPDMLMRSFFTSKEPFVNMGLHEGILILFQKLLESVNLGANGYHQLITGITLQIVAMVHSVLAHKEQHDDPTGRLIAKAKFLMRESLEAPQDMQNLARNLPMGYSKFRKEFKRATGQSPHQYHLGLRMDKARELLETTTLNINEVAYQTGFDSVFYFSKIFRKKNGLSPTAFREKKNIHL